MSRIRECHDDLYERELSHQVIGTFYDVYNALGYGFLESVYLKAMSRELVKRGFHVATEVPCDVVYDGDVVGSFRADILVESRLVLELKASQVLHSSDVMQLLNYLRATDLELGLLLHFGPKPVFKRLIATNTDARGSNSRSLPSFASSARASFRGQIPRRAADEAPARPT